MTEKPYILSVLSGPNAGAAIALPVGLATVGTSPDNTLVLDDPLGDTISFGLSGDRLRILTSAINVSIRGKGPVAANSKTATDLPAVVRLSDDTLVSVARFGSAKKARRGILPLAALIAAGLLYGADRAGYINWVAPVQDWLGTLEFNLIASPPDTAAATPETPQIAEPEPAPALCDALCASESADEFKARLIAAGLDDLTVEPSEGVIRVAGEIAHGQMDLWRSARRDFETQNKRGLAIVANIAERPAPPQIDIVTVWLGARPEVRLRNGHALRIGDKTSDGWEVSKINPDGIEVLKGHHSLTLTY